MTHFECKCFGDVLMLYLIIRSPLKMDDVSYIGLTCVFVSRRFIDVVWENLGVWTSKKAGENAAWIGHKFLFFSLCDWYLWIVCIEVASCCREFQQWVDSLKSILMQISDPVWSVTEFRKFPRKVTWILQEMKDVYWCLWLFVHLVGHVLEQVTLCWPTPVAKRCSEGQFGQLVQCLNIFWSLEVRVKQNF